MGIRSDSYAVCNTAFLNHRIGNDSSCSDSAIHYIRSICQNSLSANFRLTFQGNIGFDLNFRRNLNINIDISCFWVDKANTIDHVLVIDAATHDRLSCRKSHTVIYPKTFIKIFQSISANFFTSFTENTNDICDIVFTLSVIGIDIFQSLKQTLVVKDVSSSVDFLDLFFKICSILLLNNAKNFSIVITYNSSIAKRIIRFSSQDSSHIFMIDVEINQVFQAFTSD